MIGIQMTGIGLTQRVMKLTKRHRTVLLSWVFRVNYSIIRDLTSILEIVEYYMVW